MIQETLHWMNVARTKPHGIIPEIEKKLQHFNGRKYFEPGMKCPLITNEGPAAVHECINVLKNTQPMKPLTLNKGMSKAAQDHCDDIGPKGVCGHTGTNGSSMGSRLEKHGQWMGQIAENISFGHDEGLHAVIQLLVDDGVSSRGHRKNMLNPKVS